jgi:enoyl-CoA hydratase
MSMDATAQTPTPEPLLVAYEDDIVRLTLNRPDRLNAVSAPLYDALVRALENAGADARVRAIVLTGAGRAFCVGADLKAHAGPEPTRRDRRRYVALAQRANRAVQTCAKPVVAAVNGHAIGAGLELALSADLVVVAREAKLRLPEIAIGTFVGGGLTYTLPQRVGMARAKEILLLGEFLTPDDALAYGLVNRVVPAADVADTAHDLAGRLARRAPIPMRRARQLLGRALRWPASRALRAEADALLACMETEDWREGVRAFEERRDPVFRGR